MWINKYIMLLVFILCPSIGWAGGSYEQVIVESLVHHNKTDFTLVVRPISRGDSSQYQDPHMRGCSKFIVEGSYNRFQSWRLFPKFVTFQTHMEALTMLENSLKDGSPILFGWMGSGFHITDPTNRCSVESRALWIAEDNGKMAVMSFYNYV
jgi:hypothetical protein